MILWAGELFEYQLTGGYNVTIEDLRVSFFKDVFTRET